MNRVAILYPGEMGAALAQALRARGMVCVSPLAGRGADTVARAAAAGIVSCASLAEAVRGADLIVSLVPARAAEAVAAQVAAVFQNQNSGAATGARPVFLDANSTDPRVLPRIAAALAESGAEFGTESGLSLLDGAFVGAASRLDRDTVLLLSGPDAARIGAALAPALTVRVVGAAVGQASALKLALSVVTKGLVALTLETLGAAEAVGARDHAAALLDSLYPGVSEVARRVLPSYPRHIARRQAEIADAADWIAAAGRPAGMARATAAAFADIAAARLDAGRAWSFDTVVAALLAHPASGAPSFSGKEA